MNLSGHDGEEPIQQSCSRVEGAAVVLFSVVGLSQKISSIVENHLLFAVEEQAKFFFGGVLPEMKVFSLFTGFYSM